MTNLEQAVTNLCTSLRSGCGRACLADFPFGTGALVARGWVVMLVAVLLPCASLVSAAGCFAGRNLYARG